MQNQQTEDQQIQRLMPKKILIIAAHPDDEILGCGVTVARLIKGGSEAYTLVLGEGAHQGMKRGIALREREGDKGTEGKNTQGK